jgi:hypothetical protein
LKRFGVIIVVAVVVLAIGAGPAFASLCAGATCRPMMARAMTMSVSTSCETKTGVSMPTAACPLASGQAARDVVSNQAGPDLALAAVPLARLVVPPATVVGVGVTPLIDARGAPHLSSVIRI